MKPLEQNTPEAILKYVRDWVCLLSEDEFEEAQKWIYVPPELIGKYHNNPGITRETIAEYSVKYRQAKKSEKEKYRPKVTSPYAMDRSGEEYYLWPEEWKDTGESISGIEYYLPLEGQWSRLRADFRIIPLPDKTFGMFLSDISVP
jgi:hypothetical protein